MLPITIEGKPHALTFKHLRHKTPVFNLVRSGLAISDQTTAYIYPKKEDGKIDYHNLAAFGISFCSVEDNFNKESGRRKALERALSKYERGVKKEVWGQYEGRGRG